MCLPQNKRQNLKMEGQTFSLNIKELHELFQLAERNIKRPFNSAAKSAGRDSVKGFLTKNPILAIRKPESTIEAQTMGFNKTDSGIFFDLSETQVD